MAKTDDSPVLVDTNVLLTATTPKRPLHEKALVVLNEWPNRGVPLVTCGQILREYLVVATRPQELNGLGLSPGDALENVAAFSGRLRLLEEGQAVGQRLRRLVSALAMRGTRIHDANLVAVALVHGVARLLTANVGDFRPFAERVEIVDLAAVESPAERAARGTGG